MELNNFISLLKNRFGTIVVFMAVFFVLSVSLTVIQPLKYSSNLRLLVVQDVSASADPYTATRANEYLSEILSKITYSNTFFNQVLSSGLSVDAGYFGSSPKKIAKNWVKTINVKSVNNTGIITITAYHPKRDQAEKIARAIGSVLIIQNGNYHGLGNKVTIKLLDDPITSSYPVKPNLIVNAILSLVLGLVFSLLFIYLLSERNLFNKQQLAQPELLIDEERFIPIDLAQGSKEPIDYDFNSNQGPKKSVDYHLIKETAPLKPTVDEAPKIDWYKDF